MSQKRPRLTGSFLNPKGDSPTRPGASPAANSLQNLQLESRPLSTLPPTLRPGATHAQIFKRRYHESSLTEGGSSTTRASENRMQRVNLNQMSVDGFDPLRRRYTQNSDASNPDTETDRFMDVEEISYDDLATLEREAREGADREKILRDQVRKAEAERRLLAVRVAEAEASRLILEAARDEAAHQIAVREQIEREELEAMQELEEELIEEMEAREGSVFHDFHALNLAGLDIAEDDRLAEGDDDEENEEEAEELQPESPNTLAAYSQDQAASPETLAHSPDVYSEDEDSMFANAPGTTPTSRKQYPPPKYYDGPDPYKDPDMTVRDFHMALMMFCCAMDISFSQYTALRQALQLITSIEKDICSLPEGLGTLKARCRRNLPLMKLRGYELPISLDKVPPRSENPTTAYRFELEEYGKMILSDRSLVDHMHFGYATLNPDQRTEAWHGDVWAGSVRTTSGKFPRIGPLSIPIFPSDCIEAKDPSTLKLSRYRVSGIGIIGSGPYKGEPGIAGKKLLEISQVDWRGSNFQQLAKKTDNLLIREKYPYPRQKNPSDLTPLIMMDDIEDSDMIPTRLIERKIWVRFMDYPLSDDLADSLLPEKPTFFVQYIAYTPTDSEASTPVGFEAPLALRPIHKRHRLAAEKELCHLGRKYIETNIVQDLEGSNSKDNPRVVSLPLGFFLDDFGLYRTAYHSLAGLYFQPWSLCEAQRFVLQNMFVLMIGPFGSSGLDIAACLEDETVDLGIGRDIEVLSYPNGKGSPPQVENIRLLMFPIAFTGDMPQQNENAGVMSHKSNVGCRYCFIPKDIKGDLTYDTLRNGRYEADHDHKYKQILQHAPGGKQGRDRAFGHFGIGRHGHIFGEAFPCLDPFSNYPNDPFHCEIRLGAYHQTLLTENLLSPAGLKAYLKAWDQINVPYGWGQPQNPVSHKGSMVFSENGRLAQLNPLVLLIMFTDPETGKRRNEDEEGKSFWLGSSGRGNSTGVCGRMHELFEPNSDPDKFDAADSILGVAYSLAKVIFMTMASSLTDKEARDLPEILVDSRQKLQKAFKVAPKMAKKAECPNVHLAAHTRQDIQNYGTTRAAGTMTGEGTHKNFKQHAGNTNGKDTVLQLLKSVNLTFTVRWVLNGVFANHPMADQAIRVLHQCPGIRKKYVAAGEDSELFLSGNTSTKNTLFASFNVSSKVPVSKTSKTIQDEDFEMLKGAFALDNDGYLISRMARVKIQYYQKCVGVINNAGRPQKISVQVDKPVKLRRIANINGQGARGATNTNIYGIVKRILLVEVGNCSEGQAFFVIRRLSRDIDAEDEAAPYRIFSDLMDTDEVVSLTNLEAITVHMVPRSLNEGFPKSWWLNPTNSRRCFPLAEG